MGRVRGSRRKHAAAVAATAARPRAPVTEGADGPVPGLMTRPLAIVLAAAAVFRVAYLLQYRARSPLFDSPILDAAVYDRWARIVAAGEILPAQPFYFAPGYPYALGVFYAVVSSSTTAVFVLQSLLGLLNILLIHRLAALAYGRRVAAWAAVLTALYASFPFLEAKILSATLGLTLLLLLAVGLVSAARRPTLWRWWLAGALGGLASVVRPETLLIAPFVLFWIWRWGRPPDPVGASGTSAGARSSPRSGPTANPRSPASARWLPTIRTAAALTIGWVITIAPATIHNLRSHGGLTLISSQAGLTFYQSNNPRARGLYVSLVEEGFSGDPERQAQEEKEIAEKALGRPLTRSEVSSYWFGKGFEYIRGNPARSLWLLGMKLLRFADSYEHSTEYVLAVERETVWLLWLPFLPFGVLVALAVPAIVQGLTARGGAGKGRPGRFNAVGWLLLLMLLANLATCLVFYVSSRYRLAAAPTLIVLAAATLTSVLGTQRNRRELTGAVALVALFLGLAYVSRDASAAIQEANVHYNTGNVWVSKGDHARAVVEYRRATELDGSRFQTWFNLGSSLAELHRYAEAAAAYGSAAAREPLLFDAHAQRGLMLMEVGDWHGARDALEQAAALRPNVFDLQLALGRVAARLGDREAALLHFDHALRMWPDSRVALEERSRL